MNDLKMPLSNINPPTPFNRISALSFHRIETTNHNVIPITDRPKSHICNSGIPLIDIAANTKIDATHLTYQSKVYFGVADL